MKFKEKPVIIDAVQFDGTYNGAWKIERELDIYQDAYSFINDTFICHTFNGDMIAIKDDWIIKDKHGYLYPCKSHIFDSVYEKVAEIEEGQDYVGSLCRGCLKPKQFCTHDTTGCMC